MNSVAFSILGFDIKWYGILISLGVLLGFLVANFNCKWREIDYDTIIDIALVSLIVGIIGARLYFVVFQFNTYNGNILEMINIRNGGLAIHGGLIFGIGTAFIMCRHKKVNFLKLMDVIVPSIIIAQALGRWGNFFNQEAHGGPVSEKFIQHFPKFIQKGMFIDGTYYHPTFLYESLWDFLVFIILLIVIRKAKKKGLVFFLYIGLYSLGRFFIESLRTDSLMLGPIRVAMLVSGLGVIASIVFIIYSYRVVKK